MNHSAVCIGLSLLAVFSSAYAGDGYTLVGSQGVMHMVLINKDRATDTDLYHVAAGEICRLDPICQVMFWTENAPTSLPMTDEQVNSKTAHWQINMNTGLRRWLWDCELFGGNQGDECL